MDLNRLIGGNPIAVILRLVVLSIVVGIVLSALDINPSEFVYHVRRLARRLTEIGLPLAERLFDYLLIGALVVVPIWLVARLFGLLGGRRDEDRR